MQRTHRKTDQRFSAISALVVLVVGQRPTTNGQRQLLCTNAGPQRPASQSLDLVELGRSSLVVRRWPKSKSRTRRARRENQINSSRRFRRLPVLVVGQRPTTNGRRLLPSNSLALAKP